MAVSTILATGRISPMTITRDMPIGNVVSNYPDTIPVFLRHGLMCVGCAAARFENIEQGAAAHGIDVEVLIEDLNEAVEKKETTEAASA
jgi:hybrid cluster-associated redox disulfide protein